MNSPHYEAAAVTVQRAQRFRELLLSLTGASGLDLDALRARAPSGSPNDKDDIVPLARNAFLDRLLLHGAIEELADTVLALNDDQSPKDVPLHILNEATASFITRYVQLMTGVTDSTGAIRPN